MNKNLALLILTFLSGMSDAADLTLSCSSLESNIAEATKYVGSENMFFSPKQSEEIRYILFLQKAKENDPQQRWYLIERAWDRKGFCLIGKGEQYEALMDSHQIKSSGKYGMPGSGLPRCAGDVDGVFPPSMQVRIWANKELGESSVFSLPNMVGPKSYFFLSSKDNTGAWILLDYPNENINDTCYLSRGEASGFGVDIKPKN